MLVKEKIKNGGIYFIHYGRKYPGMPYQDRHCRVVQMTTSKPCNYLCRLRGGDMIVVPVGNIFKRKDK